MPRWLARWSEVRTAVIAGLGRFPVAVVALAIFAAEVNLAIAKLVEFKDDTLFRAAIALVGGAALATAMVLFGERRAIAAFTRHLLSLLLAMAVGAALWYWDRLAVAFPALFVAAVVSIPLAPYVRREPSGFWSFCWRLIHAAALAFIAIIVFCAGLSAIFASIDYLFGVDIDSSLYGHIWSIGLGFVGPLFALSLIPTTFPERDAPNAADIFVAGLRILSDFVAVPLLAAYVVILHVYALKILVETELPKGQIGWMVLTFGLAVLALRVAVHPIVGFAWMPTRLFLRWWPVGLVIPLALLLIALWQRIDAYGVTPERYALGLFALFLGLVLLAQVPPRLSDDIRIIPALGALALLVASFGPWSMFPASARSQMDRLMQSLTEADVLEGGRIAKTPQLSRSAAEDVRSIVRMLVQIRQTDRLAPLFAGSPDDPFGVARGSNWTETTRIWTAFNVNELPPRPGDVGTFAISSGPGAVAISGYDLVVPDLVLASVRRNALTVIEGEKGLRVRTDNMKIEIVVEGTTLAIDGGDLRNALQERLDTVERLPPGERTPFLAELDIEGRRVGLLFHNVEGKITENGAVFTSGVLDLYLRRADWTQASSGEPLRGTDP